MDPENDVQLSAPRTKQKTPPESLTLPPIELEKPVTKKKSAKRKRLRRKRPKKFSPKKSNPSNLFSQKSQSSRSSNDGLRLSSISNFVKPDRMSALKYDFFFCYNLVELYFLVS